MPWVVCVGIVGCCGRFFVSFVCRGQGGGGVGRKRVCGVCVCASSTVFYRLKGSFV